MRRRTTTRSCSAVALIAFGFLALGGVIPPAPPLSLFPVQPLWSLALNNQITVPPAFDGAIGYFAIEGSRIAAYNLAAGTQRWIIDASPDVEPTAGDGLLFMHHAGQLTARRSEDGSIAWQLPVAAELAAPAVVDNGWLIAATKGREILALRAADGAIVWRRTIGGEAWSKTKLKS